MRLQKHRRSTSNHLATSSGRLDGLKVRVVLRLFCREALLVIVAQQLVQKVDGIVRNVSLVLGRDETAPRLALVSSQDIVVLWVQIDVVLFQVGIQLIRSKHLADLDQLVVVVMTVEERFLSEDLMGG